MSGWRTMDSAPKDGTPILVAVAGEEFYPRSVWWDRELEGWIVRRHLFEATRLTVAPTHWQHLQEPPPAPDDYGRGGHSGIGDPS